MRTRKKPWTQKELTTNQRFINDPEQYKSRWNEYFHNNNPLHIEIGCGKGKFITETATQNPDINYIAIERDEHIIVTGARASRELDCSLGFIVGEVKNICEIFAPNDIERIYINFCDPWPNRKKWAKRRLTHINFLEMYKNLMGTGGEIFFKTDNRQLFEFSLEQFSQHNWLLRNVSLDLHASECSWNIMTEYEIKFHEKNMPIYRCEAICK